MNSSMNREEGGFNQDASQADRPAVKKSLRALTCKQIHSMDGNLCDDVEVATVGIVGFVSEIKKTKTGISYKLFDTTGEIDCNFWPNGNYDEEVVERVKEKILVKVTGQVKTFAEKKVVVCSMIQRGETEELIFHLCECAYEKLALTNRLGSNRQGSNRQENRTGGKTTSNVTEEILALVRENQSNTGVHSDTIIAMLSGKYNEKEIKEGIETLGHNLHLYQVDGGNYKTTV